MANKSKVAFMSDYVSNAKFDNGYNDTFCELCPLQEHQWGGCSKDLSKGFDTCIEEIFKFYVENSNEGFNRKRKQPTRPA